MDIKGKTVVVTGATSGLGQAAAVAFAKRGARVLVAGRDSARANETVAQAGGNAEAVLGDVSTKAGAKALAAAILAKTDAIHVLVNNAGGQFKTMTTTADGIETTFALNTVGAYVLTRELHGALAKAQGRVVNLATGFLDGFPVDPDDIAAPKKFSSLKQYAMSKQASVMMTVEQAKRFEKDGVKVVSMHPGIIMGTRFNGGQPKALQMIGGPIMRAIGLACTMDEAVRRFSEACFGDVPTGSYMQKGAPTPLPKQVNDVAIREKTFALIERLAA